MENGESRGSASWGSRPFCMENAMKMVNRAVRRWEGGRAKNPGRRPNRMENGESRGSAMGGGRAQTGRGNTLDIWHFVTKMYKNKKEQRQIHFFGAARQKSLLCYQKLVQGRGLRRRPAGGPGAAAEGCGASVQEASATDRKPGAAGRRS